MAEYYLRHTHKEQISTLSPRGYKCCLSSNNTWPSFFRRFLWTFHSNAAALRDGEMKSISVALPATFFLAQRHKTSVRCCSSQEQTDKKRSDVCSCHGKKMCDHRQSDDSLYFKQRALCPWRPILAHEYLTQHLTVIGYCGKASGLVCAHCQCLQQHTTVSQPTSDSRQDGSTNTWNK